MPSGHTTGLEKYPRLSQVTDDELELDELELDELELDELLDDEDFGTHL